MSFFSSKTVKHQNMPGYDREYDREYEADYDTEGQEEERLKGARAADRAFAASLPSAVQVQNSITMGDVSGSTGESYFASLKGAWQENKRRVITILSVAVVLAVASITMAISIDRKPAPSAAQSAAAPVATSAQPTSSTAVNSTTVPVNLFEGKECVGNTITHQEPLKVNQFICSKANQYIFGLNSHGDLVWGNVDSNFQFQIFAAKPDYYTVDKFMLGSHGRFEILDAIDQMIWNKQSIYGNDVKPMAHNPINNQSVPYLSMHNDGVVVLVYYNATTDLLEEHNIQKVYPGISITTT